MDQDSLSPVSAAHATRSARAQAAPAGVDAGAPGSANELDLRRIVRRLAARRRYRYVAPTVQYEGGEGGAYRISCACCSRNIDADGGVIDIARLVRDTGDDATPCWTLYRKDHAAGVWEPVAQAPRLDPLMDELNRDPNRKFWP